jgi:hypothetical protein
MAGESIFSKIGKSMGAKPGTVSAPPSAKAGIKPPVPGSKPFDINLYFKAVGMFFSDFYGKKVPYFFQNMGPVMKKAPDWWKKLPQDEQISYGALGLGHVLLIVGIVLLIVL